uniref:Transposase n=1 Tax=Chenopodium quinoa TaxID=63459 RepID=A0A803MTZ2_CHEQI
MMLLVPFLDQSILLRIFTFLMYVMKVRLLLKDEMENVDSFVRKMALRMWGKFEKYWSDFSPIMAIAAIMDPRFKFQFVSFSYAKVYGSNASFEVSSLKEKLFEMFDAYVSSSTRSNGGPSTTSNHNQGVNVATVDGFMEDFDDSSGVEFASTPKSELELYLEEPLIPCVNELDILDYWKSCQLRFPVLSLMARDLLCKPTSTVASESAFSIGGRVLDPVRSSLKPSVVEALICLRD